MTVAPKRAVPKELIDGLLADYKKPEDLIGENGLLKQLTKMLVERPQAIKNICWSHPTVWYLTRKSKTSSDAIIVTLTLFQQTNLYLKHIFRQSSLPPNSKLRRQVSPTRI